MHPLQKWILSSHPARFGGLLTAALILYFPALQGEFIWDDWTYIVENPYLKEWTGLGAIWFSHSLPDYWPLSYTFLLIQWQLFADQTLGYHLVNLLLHALNALLVWKIAEKGKVKWAPLIGLAFLLHPMSVEAAAWIFQQKTTLAMALFLGSLLCFLHFLEKKQTRLWALAALLFSLSLLSKPIAVLAPLAFLYPWKELQLKDRLKWSLPFLMTSFVLGSLNLYWYLDVRQFPVAEFSGNHTLWDRFVFSGWALGFYLVKTLLPLEPQFIYPSFVQRSGWISLIPSLAAVFLLIAAWAALKKMKYQRASLGFLFGLLLLIPVLGVFDIPFMRYSPVADHWLYPALPFFIYSLAALGLHLPGKLPVKAWLLTVWLMACAFFSWKHTQLFASYEGLLTATIQSNPQSWMAYNNLGVLSGNRGQLQEAQTYFQSALQITDRASEVLLNYASLLSRSKKYGEAIPFYEKAIAADSGLNPKALAETKNSYGVALAQTRRFAEAEKQFREALQLYQWDEPRLNLQILLEEQKSTIPARPSQ